MTEPQIIEITGNLEKFKYIYCCYNSSFAITTKGFLFSWGNNEHGKLGQGNNEEICIPRKVNLFNVKKICGFRDSFFLTNEGNIYFCNKNQNTPKIIETKNKFTDLEHFYFCDSEKMFYYLNKLGKIELIGKFESFIELIGKEKKITPKIIYIRDIISYEMKIKFIEEKIRNLGKSVINNY